MPVENVFSCGFCAAAQRCMAGGILEPNDDSVSCGIGEEGWGWHTGACTLQALCNMHSHTNCSGCLSALDGSSCGYCKSTQRCEWGFLDAPLDYDCDSIDWFFSGPGQCEAPAWDQCNAHMDCVSCENADPKFSCGFCQSTGTCQTGSAAGPAISGSCPTNSTWSFHNCSSDALCYAAQSCGSCNILSNCLWCGSTGTCMPGKYSPTPGHTCDSGSVTPYRGNCPRPTPQPQPDIPFPSTGTWAVLCIVVGCLLMSLRSLFYFKSTRRTPVLGSRITPRFVVRDFQSGWRKAFPLFIAASVLVAKVSALLTDMWDAWWLESSWNDEIVGHSYYGLYQVRTQMLGVSQTIQYADQCSTKTGTYHRMCQTMRVAGVLTLVSACLSVFFTLYFIVVAVGAFRRGAFASRAIKLWRLIGLTQTCSIAAYWFWLLGAHPILRWQDDDRPGVATSWILFLCAWVAELILLVFMRRAVASTPPEGQEALLAYVQQQPHAGPAPAYAGASPYVVYAAQPVYPSAPSMYQPPQHQPGYAAYPPQATFAQPPPPQEAQVEGMPGSYQPGASQHTGYHAL